MNNQVNILVVEDDKNTGILLRKHLEAEGFQIKLCVDGAKGLKCFEEEIFELCILDIMLPSMDGLKLAETIRKNDLQVPIIFLTARNLKSDKVQGYNNGCDDYITKPFDIDELILKIHAMLRRVNTVKEVSKEIKVSDLCLLTSERLLVSTNKKTKLSHKEMLLLEQFFTHFNTVVSRSDLLINCWGNDDYFSSNILNVYLTKIRKLIREDNTLELQNIHGYGYKLCKKISDKSLDK